MKQDLQDLNVNKIFKETVQRAELLEDKFREIERRDTEQAKSY